MNHGIRTTIDRAGRLVLPKPIREQAGISPGMELEISVRRGRVEITPAPREVQVVRRGGLRVAVPSAEQPKGDEGALRQEDVWQTLRAIRNRNPAD